MEIEKALKFVSSAVSAASSLSGIGSNHFIIENGQVRATNGTLTLGAPIFLDLKCTPKASVMQNAVKQCKDVISLSLVNSGNRLRVSSGKFSAYVPCQPERELPEIPKPSGQQVELSKDALRHAFTSLERFVGTDELRPWTNGVLLRGGSAYATNNVSLAECWLGGAQVPFEVNIPSVAVKEILKIKEDPTSILVDGHSITFMYEDGRWVKSRLLETDWPEVIYNILNAEGINPQPFPPELFEAVKALDNMKEPDRRIYLKDGYVATSEDYGVGSRYEVDGLKESGVYRSDIFMLMEGLATSADMSRFPQPLLFFGDNIRGAISGMNR